MRKTQGTMRDLTEALEAAADQRALEKNRLETALARQGSVIGSPDGGQPAQRSRDIEAATNQYTAVLKQVSEGDRTLASELMWEYVATLFETGLSAKEVVTIHIRALDTGGQAVSDHEQSAFLASSRDLLLEVLVNLVDLYRASAQGGTDEVRS